MQCVKQGELMKMRGNEEFSKEKFEIAVIYYTRAIEYRPENHLLYGNRALCFLRMGQFRNALSDGKRAIVLKNTWPKVSLQDTKENKNHETMNQKSPVLIQK